MFKTLTKLAKDDTDTLCIARMGSIISFTLYNVYALYGLYHGHFDLSGYGSGIMNVLLGSAGLLLGKNVMNTTAQTINKPS